MSIESEYIWIMLTDRLRRQKKASSPAGTVFDERIAPNVGRVQPESLAEQLQHGCLGRDLPGATEQCWNAGNWIDAQGMEDRGGELA